MTDFNAGTEMSAEVRGIVSTAHRALLIDLAKDYGLGWLARVVGNGSSHAGASGDSSAPSDGGGTTSKRGG